MVLVDVVEAGTDLPDVSLALGLVQYKAGAGIKRYLSKSGSD